VNETHDSIMRDMGLEEVVHQERSYRRGYHQAWDAAIDAIFDMLDAGLSSKDAYSLSALYVNSLALWRVEDAEIRIAPPRFCRATLWEALQIHRRKHDGKEDV
jgi:hypothetical protein